MILTIQLLAPSSMETIKSTHGNGEGLNLSHIGHLVFSSRVVYLKNLLHVPSITKNLITISQFSKDNNTFHHDFCFLKDQVIN